MCNDDERLATFMDDSESILRELAHEMEGVSVWRGRAEYERVRSHELTVDTILFGKISEDNPASTPKENIIAYVNVYEGGTQPSANMGLISTHNNYTLVVPFKDGHSPMCEVEYLARDIRALA